MKAPHVLQNETLNQARIKKASVTLFLVNGYRLNGSVISFDQYTVLLQVGNKQNLIFKHAISTIVLSGDAPNIAPESNNRQ